MVGSGIHFRGLLDLLMWGQDVWGRWQEKEEDGSRLGEEHILGRKSDDLSGTC